MLSDVKPFKICDNLYFVGCKAFSSHIIDTGGGLIMLDNGYEENAYAILESMEMLGLSAKDVKKIVITHGHGDHFRATPILLDYCDAETYLSRLDYNETVNFKPDVLLSDGDDITLGNTTIHCMLTPGHTPGVMSFFFDVTDRGKTYRAGMFGGTGIKQMSKDFLDPRSLLYFQRRDFFESIERLRKEKVEIFLGNHCANNQTVEKAERMTPDGPNPFYDPEGYQAFLDEREQELSDLILSESRTHFVNYAHRGASAYEPENTMISFRMAQKMGANGIETDIRKTKDGVLVLFHDKKPERLIGLPGEISDYTYEELQKYRVKKNGHADRIPTLYDFLARFYTYSGHLALELKAPGIEAEVNEMLRAFHLEARTVVTSFQMEYVANMKRLNPYVKTGFLAKELTDELYEKLRAIGCDELCPEAQYVTPEAVEKWHRLGFRVRAWGVSTEEEMRRVYACHVDGMTVNFPDKLRELITAEATE